MRPSPFRRPEETVVRLAKGVLTAALVAIVGSVPAIAYQLNVAPDTQSVPENAGMASWTVTLAGCPNPLNDATVTVSVQGAGTNPGDPGTDTGVPSPATFLLGPNVQTMTVSLPIVDDAMAEPTESFQILFTPDSAPIDCADGSSPPSQTAFPAFFEIVDDDGEIPPPSGSSLRIGDTSVTEGDAGTRVARFQVRLEPASNEPVSVDFATRNGSADAGLDFRAASGTLEFSSGVTVLPVDVAVLGDRVVEGDETFFVELSKARGASIADGTGRGVIRDDDQTPLDLEGQDTSRSGREGDILELAVRVTEEGTSEPAAGVHVTWGLEGDAVPADGTGSRSVTSVSDDQGIARLSVRLGQAPGQASVTATIPGGAFVTFQIEIRGDLAPLFDPEGQPGPRSVAEVLDEACVQATGALLGLCRRLYELPDEQARIGILELTPREAAAMGLVGRDGARTQVDNVLDHLAVARRGRRSRADVADLSFSIQGQRIAANTLRNAPASYRETEVRFAALVEEALEGAEPVAAPLEPETVPRWSIFVSGQVASGDYEGTGATPDFDLDTTGITVGFDYQASSRWLVGFAGGWLDSSSDFANREGSLDVEGYSGTLFAGYARDAFYFDLAGTWGSNDYEISRFVHVPSPILALEIPLYAKGSPSGDQTAFAAAVGYDASFGAAGLGFFARASRVDVTIDAFEETGALGADLILDQQDLDSFLTEAGFELTYAVSASWGVFLPQLRAAWLHEFEDDARTLRGRFAEDPMGLEFVVPTDGADPDYFNAGLGFTATFARGWSAYLFADQDLERDDFDLLTVSGGFRVEL